mgnify:CR=1 FL=1
MVNRLYNKQVSPKGYDEGGQVKKTSTINIPKGSTINIPKGYHPIRGFIIEGRIRRGDTQKKIYDEHKKIKEKLFKRGVKPSQIIKLDKEFDRRYESAVKRIRRGKRALPDRDMKGESDFKKGGKV